MRIHPVFHNFLLKPYIETSAHGPNFAQPPPEIVGGVKTYYCLRQAVGDNLIFEVEVIDPKDEQGDIQEKDSEVKA